MVKLKSQGVICQKDKLCDFWGFSFFFFFFFFSSSLLTRHKTQLSFLRWEQIRDQRIVFNYEGKSFKKKIKKKKKEKRKKKKKKKKSCTI